MGSNFSKIKVGTIFKTSDGEAYRKTSELTFEGLSTGIEQYIDPFFDKKIGGTAPAAPVIDTSARVVKDNEEAPKTAKKKAAPKKKAAKKSK